MQEDHDRVNLRSQQQYTMREKYGLSDESVEYIINQFSLERL